MALAFPLCLVPQCLSFFSFPSSLYNKKRPEKFPAVLCPYLVLYYVFKVSESSSIKIYIKRRITPLRNFDIEYLCFFFLRGGHHNDRSHGERYRIIAAIGDIE